MEILKNDVDIAKMSKEVMRSNGDTSEVRWWRKRSINL